MALVVCAITLAACEMDISLGGRTSGDLGRTSISYESCLFGCAVDDPMARGAREPVKVTGGWGTEAPALVAVGAPVVAVEELTVDELDRAIRFDAVAVTTGVQRFELRTAAGVLFDRFSLEVVDATRITVEWQSSAPESAPASPPIVAAVGEQLVIHLDAFAGDARLFSRGAFELALSPADLARVTYPIVSFVFIDMLRPGTATLDVALPAGPRLEIPITVE